MNLKEIKKKRDKEESEAINVSGLHSVSLNKKEPCDIK